LFREVNRRPLALPRSENRKRALDLGTAESAFEMQIQSGVAEDCPDRLLAARRLRDVGVDDVLEDEVGGRPIVNA
jgi:hypothetical protein